MEKGEDSTKKLSFSHYSRKRIALTALAFLGAYIMSSSLLVETAWALPPTRLTNNNVDDVSPQIDGGLAVWSGLVGSNYEIFYAIKNLLPIGPEWLGPFQLTNNNYDDVSPQVRNNRVVWYGRAGPSGTSEIFLWAPLDPAGNVIQQITFNNYEDWYPVIDENGIIAWMGLPGSNWMIYWCNGLSYPPINGPLGAGAHNVRPEIDNGKIVWMIGAGFMVYYYDTNTLTGPIGLWGGGWGFTPWPQIDNGVVVWSSRDPLFALGVPGHTDSEIWMYNSNQPISPTNPKAITNNVGNDGGVQIDGGKIVWEGYDPTTPTDVEIWYRDLNQPTEQQITFNTWDDLSPQIDGGKITWMAKSPPGTDWEIWYKDTAPSGIGPIRLHSNNNVDDINPQIWDGTLAGVSNTTPWVVWQRWDIAPPPANWEIFAATP